MANIKSQIKRNRQNDKRRLRNRVVRGDTRSAVKNARAVIETGNAETAKVALKQAISALDKAAEKGVLHKNNVARRKSRLMKKLAAIPAKTMVEPQPAETVAAIEPEPTPAKKATPRKRTAAPKAAETQAVEVAEKAEPKAKKPAEKKPAKASASKAKPAAAKTTAKKTTAAKKTSVKK